MTSPKNKKKWPSINVCLTGGDGVLRFSCNCDEAFPNNKICWLCSDRLLMMVNKLLNSRRK